MFKNINIYNNYPPHKNNAFTLAETMIAIVIIGVIAAITVPNLIHQYQERLNSQRQSNIVYKINQATSLMKNNGALMNGFNSAEEYVNELKKYIKIMKICNSEHIAECWPTSKVRTMTGETFEVKDAKTRGNLGFEDNQSEKTVGIVLADGATIILTYDKTAAGLTMGEPNAYSVKLLPVGKGLKEYLDYYSTSSQGLAFVMDVNGGKGPNSETIDNKYYDIRSYANAHFTTAEAPFVCPGTKTGGMCFSDPVPQSQNAYNCRTDEENDPLCNLNTRYASDKWVGAQRYCSNQLGMTLPDVNTLVSICQKKGSKYEGLPASGRYWSSSIASVNQCQDCIAHWVDFSSCSIGRDYREGSGGWNAQVMCIRSDAS